MYEYTTISECYNERYQHSFSCICVSFHKWMLKIIQLNSNLSNDSELADVCVFLASDKSTYITGAAVEVTGKTDVFPHVPMSSVFEVTIFLVCDSTMRGLWLV